MEEGDRSCCGLGTGSAGPGAGSPGPSRRADGGLAGVPAAGELVDRACRGRVAQGLRPPQGAVLSTLTVAAGAGPGGGSGSTSISPRPASTGGGP